MLLTRMEPQRIVRRYDDHFSQIMLFTQGISHLIFGSSVMISNDVAFLLE